MHKANRAGVILLAAVAMALVIGLGWNQTSPAQSLGRSAKGGYVEFDALLAKHGDKNMLLEARVHTAKKGEILGKVVQSTEAFLWLKAQNGRDLYIVTWDDVIWITARPN